MSLGVVSLVGVGSSTEATSLVHIYHKLMAAQKISLPSPDACQSIPKRRQKSLNHWQEVLQWHVGKVSSILQVFCRTILGLWRMEVQKMHGKKADHGQED